MKESWFHYVEPRMVGKFLSGWQIVKERRGFNGTEKTTVLDFIEDINAANGMALNLNFG